MKHTDLRNIIREELKKSLSKNPTLSDGTKVKFDTLDEEYFEEEQSIAENNDGRIGDAFFALSSTPSEIGNWSQEYYDVFFPKTGELLHAVHISHLTPIQSSLNEGKGDKFNNILEGLDGLIKKMKNDLNEPL